MRKKKKDFIILKVYSGVHRNVEINLENNGSYLIGSSVNDDIILHDKTISKNHAEITIKDNKMFITPVNGEVYVGFDHIDTNTYVAFKKFFILSSIVISCRLSSHKPQSLDSEVILDNLKKAKKSRLNSKLDRDGREHYFLHGLWKGCKHLWQKCKNAFHIKNFYLSLLSKISVAILFIAVVFMSTVYIYQIEEIEDKQSPNVGWSIMLQEIKSKFPEVDIVTDKAGKIAFGGYVVNKDDRKKLINLIKGANYDLPVKVITINDILSMSNDAVINANYDNINISYDRNGAIVIDGLVDDEYQKKNVENIILSDVPIVNGVKNLLVPLRGINDEILSISIGKKAYIKLKSGKKLHVGSEIRPGVVIEKIQNKIITFIYQKQEIIYDFISGKVSLKDNKGFF